MSRIVRPSRSPVGGTLDADTVNRALENLARQDRLTALAPLSLERSLLSGRTLMIEAPPAAKPMPVQLGVESGTRAGEYEWAELQSNADGTLTLRPGGRIGNLTDHPAYEINGTADLAGKNALLFPGKGDYYWFQHIRDQAGCTRTCLTLLNARYYVEGKPLGDYYIGPGQPGIPTESFVADKIEVFDPNDVLIYSAARDDGTNRPRNQACFDGSLPDGTYKVRVTKNDCVQDRLVTVDGNATVDPDDPSQTCRYYVWCACAHVQVLFHGCDQLRWRLGTMHVTGVTDFDAPIRGSSGTVHPDNVAGNTGYVVYALLPIRLPWEPGTLPAAGDVVGWDFAIPYAGYTDPAGTFTVQYDGDLDLSAYDPDQPWTCTAEAGVSVIAEVGVDPGFLCGCVPRPLPRTFHYSDNVGYTGTITAVDPDQSPELRERTWQGTVGGSCAEACLPGGGVGPASLSARVTLHCSVGQLQYDGLYRVTWTMTKEMGSCIAVVGGQFRQRVASFGTTGSDGVSAGGTATEGYTVDDKPMSLTFALHHDPNNPASVIPCLDTDATLTE